MMDKIITEEEKSVYRYLVEAENNNGNILSKLDEIYDILDVATTEYPVNQAEAVELKKAVEYTTIKGMALSINNGSYSIIEKLDKILRLLNREFQDNNYVVNKS